MAGYCSLDIEIFENTQYDDYITWLNGSGASNVVDELDEETSQSTLNQFITYAEDQYDSLSIQGRYSYTTLTATNQKVGWCINQFFINNGILCVVADTANSASQVTTTYQWWFPANDDAAPTGDDLVDGFDPTDALYDDYRIDGDYYAGLTHYWTDLSLNSFTSAKFQLLNPSSDEQWANVKDFRFQLLDYVNIYGMYENDSGTIHWSNFEQVKLGAISGVAMSAAALATAALLSF